MRKYIQTGLIVPLMAIAFPGVTSAAARNLKEFVYQLVDLLNLATLTLFSVAVAIFFISVVRNLWNFEGGSAEKKKQLQTTLGWGIMILFVMVSLWGIIAILQATLSRGL